MSSLVSRMREERDRPAVLAHAVLRTRSENPNAFVFIFEGVEDVAVYEQLIRGLSAKLTYEPIPASGKKQVLGYMRSLIGTGSRHLTHVYAFIDRDFDVEIEASNNIYEIDAHSFENIICTSSSLESLLLDEFKCSAHPIARKQILEKFEQIFENAKIAMYEVNFILFVSQRSGKKIIKKPEKLSHFLRMDLEGVVPNFADPTDVVVVDLSSVNIDHFRREYENLNDLLRYRGKYIYMIFKKWIELLFLVYFQHNSPRIAPQLVALVAHSMKSFFL